MSAAVTPRGPAPARKKTVSKKPRAIAAKKPVRVIAYSGLAKVPAKAARPASFHPMSVMSLLGGDAVLHAQPRTCMEWIEVIRRGIPSSAVDALARSIQVSQSEFSTFLGIPERTLVRRKKEGVLGSEESAKLVRMARVANRAREVFEDFGSALEWLKSPNASLSGATPMSLLDTEIGAESVMDTLGRIEHGVFA